MQYYAYGRLYLKHKEDIHNPLRFQGQYFDAESGLHYNRHRYYNPNNRRFITADPIGLAGGLNNYQYVKNPTGWVDPLGLADVPMACACSGSKGESSSGEATSQSPDGVEVPSVTNGLVNPNSIRFTQDSIKATFKDGRSLKGLIDDLKSGKVTADDLPAIRIFERDGKVYSLDNRRLKAFQEAGVSIRTRPATADEIANEVFKFTTKNEGVSIRIRGGGL